jgi:alkanesulfonate monooxygenase SsuD/methylene tetrahydromethanopterin reductase-like flavin-dependent oxidoreductase (luciferase family)
VCSPHEVYGGNGDASYRGGSQIGRLDLTILVSAMASVTKNLCFGITGSTSYIRKCGSRSLDGMFLLNFVAAYMLTRMWSTMDHVTEGRIGWNIVASYSTPAAKAFGHNAVVPHDEHYAAAEEYIELCYKYVFQHLPTRALIRIFSFKHR